jgi:hypothetical protein
MGIDPLDYLEKIFQIPFALNPNSASPNSASRR